MSKCPRCNQKGVVGNYGNKHCMLCGWETTHQILDNETARKEVERYARTKKRMQERGEYFA